MKRSGGNTATGKIWQKSRLHSILKSSEVARWNPDSPWFVSKCVGLEPKLLVRSLPWTSDKVVFLSQCWLMKRFGSTVGEARKVSTSSTITVQWAAPADNGCPMTGWPTESLWIAVAARTCYWNPGMRRYALNEWKHIVNVAFVVIYSKTRFFFKCDFGCTSFDVFVEHAPYESWWNLWTAVSRFGLLGVSWIRSVQVPSLHGWESRWCGRARYLSRIWSFDLFLKWGFFQSFFFWNNQIVFNQWLTVGLRPGGLGFCGCPIRILK